MNTKVTLLAGAALLAFCQPAEAQQLRGTYAAIEAGASWIVDDERFFQDSIFTTGAYTYDEYRGDFDRGWALFGSIGYAFENRIRVELELGYRDNEFEQLYDSSSSPIDSGGGLSEFSIMANLLYDIPLGKRWSVSLGGGVGMDRANLKVDTLDFDDSDWRFAYQGIAGLNYAIGERTQLFLNYRFLHVDAPEFTWYEDVTPGITHRTIFLSDINKQSVSLGLRVAFNGPDVPPPPPPVTPPPPPPPPPPMPDQFVVFFGFNKSNISGEAMQVITDAATTAKEKGSASIIIIGHTDSSGSDAYNEALSLRRATAVKGALVSLGIAEDKISPTGKGETELLVKTGDGVKEPQNRRATIDLK
jgi:outer membrane protein OmpA-like peptidoglycan-associated protein/opacity protein-like surface antigen